MKPGNTARYDIEYRVVPRDGSRERWVSEKGRAILDSAGHAKRFIGTILDITEPKTAALALERAKQQAEDANRAKDEVRTRYIEQLGFRVIRLWNNDVLANLDGVLEQILIELKRR